ncbi:MAG: NAD(P)/FAD-dependent oxidoreductase [Acidobacteriota bacterium]|nr:MAG: NAD(P)/FAD-dependent oxidoreductase [Acidobacteriota bacterium]
MADIANVVIIGGGVVGTAIAAEVSRRTDDVFVLEKLPRLGLGTSTRNSGVIHAGIYYRPGSLKALHCVRGASMLYRYCSEHNIPCKRIGKLIVAESMDQLPELESLKARGETNGVEGLEIIDRQAIERLEPNVISAVAINSPNTGIVEPEELVKALARQARENGAHLLTDTPVIAIEVRDDLVYLRTPREEVPARVVINAAGLYADEVARMFGFDRHTIHPCRGEYAELPPSLWQIVGRLIYPLPLPSGHGLGVHFTLNLAGAVLLGPNARYVKSKEDYESDRTPLLEFYEDASKMVRGLRIEDLRPSYSGIRPRLLPEHDHSFADFVIEADPNHQQVIHLIGIESPGLTSALSIGLSVGEMVDERLR